MQFTRTPEKHKKSSITPIIITAVLSVSLTAIVFRVLGVSKNDYNSLALYCDTLQKKYNELEKRLVKLENPASTEIIAPEENTDTAFAAAPNSSETVWVTKSGTKYHKEGCSALRGAGASMTLEEALSSGLEACKKCF